MYAKYLHSVRKKNLWQINVHRNVPLNQMEQNE